ncbi:hypothetical protein Y032_0501g2603 [Ancylostoma ceylanicum]|nr:hypothetical protein Y032_0501g2603 [Ancylostoma ceylanicum]
MSETTKVDLCRKYFIIGLFCLPLVWLTNFIWFFGEAFCRPSSSCNHTIRKYVVLSGLGVIFWFIVIFSWEFVFQPSASHHIARMSTVRERICQMETCVTAAVVDDHEQVEEYFPVYFTFQTYRRQGLVWADYLTFIFPVGRV